MVFFLCVWGTVPCFLFVCFLTYIVYFCWILSILNNIATFPTLFQIKWVPLKNLQIFVLYLFTLWEKPLLCTRAEYIDSGLLLLEWHLFFKQSAGLGQQPLVFSAYLSWYGISDLWISYSEGGLGPQTKAYTSMVELPPCECRLIRGRESQISQVFSFEIELLQYRSGWVCRDLWEILAVYPSWRNIVTLNWELREREPMFLVASAQSRASIMLKWNGDAYD